MERLLKFASLFGLAPLLLGLPTLAGAAQSVFTPVAVDKTGEVLVRSSTSTLNA